MTILTYNEQLKPLFTYFLWDILYTLDGQKNFVGSEGFDNTQIAKYLNADTWFSEDNPYNPTKAREYIKQHAENWFAQNDFNNVWENSIPAILHDNVTEWVKLFHFNAAEKRLLTFCVLLHSQSTLVRFVAQLGDLDDSEAYHTLSVLLRQPESEIIAAFYHKAKLVAIGLLKLDSSSTYMLRSKIDILSNKFAELMMKERMSPVDMLKAHIQAAPSTQLTPQNFAHLGVLNEAALQHVKHAFATKQKGCNILLHGAAGVGKTEFTRVLSQAAGVELFEISWEDEDGDPADRDDRLNALRMAQSILAGQNVMLMFDEVEDVFDRSQRSFSLNKAWLNRHLENNPVPTVWICNHVHMIDPSVIRRFDMVIEMKAPPTSVRAEMIRGYTHTFYNESQIQGLAEHDALVPAILKQAHKVTQNMPNWQPEQQGELFRTLLKNTLHAQGNFQPLQSQSKLPEIYNVAWVNSKQDLNAIAQGVAKAGRGTICLYGAAGTGKSAYAAWLAKQADKRIIYKRASDLLDKYVGETEQRIAAAFEEAQAENAVLVFDEVDSFLQDRRGARQSWEVSHVNEMLTQMESYTGIFIASTNLMHNLDQAALRRFDFKIEFGYLRGEQAWGLFCAYAEKMSLSVSGSLKSEIVRLKNVTAGDFAVLIKQARIMPFANSEAMLKALQAECAMKEGAKGTMGFF
ncbi:AAA family ATPase [Wielerella bovis]|uniref:AAA family ATPase n=1 Tax=Wielerella bovis TaxID=2917790 RepID=UPI002019CDF8|nr:ATP-binding protein [Wielerella bovis]ULJ64936.1 ATP-binding protein [Wielerella bovis]ULJ67210.1 ATP-binding protein [Wielerella bovis]